MSSESSKRKLFKIIAEQLNTSKPHNTHHWQVCSLQQDSLYFLSVHFDEFKKKNNNKLISDSVIFCILPRFLITEYTYLCFIIINRQLISQMSYKLTVDSASCISPQLLVYRRYVVHEKHLVRGSYIISSLGTLEVQNGPCFCR